VRRLVFALHCLANILQFWIRHFVCLSSSVRDYVMTDDRFTWAV